jgi:hypothetical protein
MMRLSVQKMNQKRRKGKYGKLAKRRHIRGEPWKTKTSLTTKPKNSRTPTISVSKSRECNSRMLLMKVDHPPSLVIPVISIHWFGDQMMPGSSSELLERNVRPLRKPQKRRRSASRKVPRDARWRREWLVSKRISGRKGSIGSNLRACWKGNGMRTNGRGSWEGCSDNGMKSK